MTSKGVGEGLGEKGVHGVGDFDAVDAGVSAKRLAEGHLGERGWSGFIGWIA